MKPMFNIFCQDLDRVFNFYQAISGWKEILEASSPIYRVLHQEGTQIAFNGFRAYELLGLSDRQPESKERAPVSTMVTFVVQEPGDVDALAARVSGFGGSVVQGPFPTYYGHWQVVLQDPERNILRATCPKLPHGVEPSKVNFGGK
ncbi:VOC family protein [Zoogloea sp. LCSB751]|uniref:VOC family protein n=1 Tax=Zoogloea sp. LCSB751 TaxID=1965277 RepID=UPI0009A54A20|nr:VOC family protein [Zoogloea sp. LCSB751]